MSKLTPKQEAFCREYLKDLNQTKAAERAGFSKRTAKAQAAQLMDKPAVREVIQDLMDKRAKRVEVDGDQVLAELKLIGHSDIRELFDEFGCVKPILAWPEHIARTVSSIEVFEEYQGKGEDREYLGQTKKVKFWDKLRALELMGKHKKLFTDRVEHSGTITLEDIVAGSASEDKE